MIAVYSIKNNISGEEYIGSAKDVMKRCKRHFHDLKIGKHHSIKFQNSYDLYGKEAFSIIILEEFLEYDKKDMFLHEQKWIDYYNSRESGLNIASANFGDTRTYHPNKKDINDKIKDSLNERISLMSEKDRKIIFGRCGEENGMFNKQHSEESKMKMSKNTIPLFGENNPFFGKKHSEETKRLLSELAKERKLEKNPFYGKHHSDETKRKLAENRRGIMPSNARKVLAENVEYNSVTECAKFYNVSPSTIINRIRRNNGNFSYL